MSKKLLLKNKTLIIGSGRFGSSIANKYCEQGKNVMVIDNNKEHFGRLSDSFSGYTFVGDATDRAILEKAGIDSCKDIIIATGNDNINLLVAHMARLIYDVPRIYVRLEDPSSEVLLKGLKINAIFPFELTFDEFDRLKGGQK